MTPERVVALARDVMCLTVSVMGIAWQAYTGIIHAELLTLYMGLLTWSGASNIWAARPRGSGGQGSWSGRPPPASSGLPASSSSASETVGGGEQ